jgi:3-deoxy-7-phosphoheptulonate synthase
MIVFLKQGTGRGVVEHVGNLLAERSLEAVRLVSQDRTCFAVLSGAASGLDLGFLDDVAGVDRVVAVVKDHPLVSGDPALGRSSVRIGNRAEIGPRTFTLISGPCAIETPEQASRSWSASVAAGATVLRGDLFKHRTSPYSFQGLGAAGVELLAEQRRRLGLPVVLEVLGVPDLEVVADVADVIRVGSRNMQNRELLIACGSAGKPIMLKRALSATIDEWLLAAETIAGRGNPDVILCERGIRTFEPATRNTLDLSAVAVLQQRSHLPVIVDPSHAVGSRSLVAPMAMAAVAAGADGVMVDVHPSPEDALCDGPQALLPHEVERLGAGMRSLAVWMGRTVSEPPASALADLDVRLADVPLAAAGAGTALGTRP